MMDVLSIVWEEIYMENHVAVGAQFVVFLFKKHEMLVLSDVS